MILLAVVVLGLAYFLLQGKTGSDSSITAQMEQRLEALTGAKFDVRIGELNLDFSNLGHVSLKSDDIAIVRRSDETLLAEIGTFEVSTRLIDILTGKYNFEFAQINEARLDAAVLGSGQALFLPAHLNKPLDATGETFARLYENFSAEGFESFEIFNSTIVGPVLGRKRTDPLTIDRLSIVPLDRESFSISGLFRTEMSDIEITSNYSKASALEPATYRFDASGIDLREWLEDPVSDKGVVASDSVVQVRGVIPFDAQNQALDPSVKIVSSESRLRVGLYSTTDVKTAVLNFRLLLDKNQIELDSSEIEIGGLKASIIGGIKPANEQIGYLGPLLYDIIMEKGQFIPKLEGEKVVPAGFKLDGFYDRSSKRLEIGKVILTTARGAIIGSGSVGFEGETPSIKATATTNGISVLALKQFWPFFLAQGARKWFHDHVMDGWVSSGTVFADVPPGVIFRLRQGAKLKPEEYKTVLNVQGLKFRPFGEIPPISDATGTVTLHGMSIAAEMADGEASGLDTKPVKINSASFFMKDFAAKQRQGSVNMELDGDIRAIAAIANRKPLRIMERMKVQTEQFTGNGHANIAVRFPVGRKAQYEEIDWNILLELQNVASSRKLDGRDLSNANVLVDANPAGAKVTGTMTIDGVKGRINFLEPIGKSGTVKRKREVYATLDDAARKRLGINLEPVIEGPVDVVALQQNGSEKYTLDLTNTKIALPWVGWSKGTDIPATGQFELERLNGSVRLENFSIRGTGFESQGKLELDKRGLVYARLPKLMLNQGDDISLEVKRENDTYNVIASGYAYDARGIINSLIHQSGFTKAQGNRSVNLTAEIATVMGFEKRTINNASLVYESRNGVLHRLEMDGTENDGRFYSVRAQKEGDQTQFRAQSNDAGTALAFTNVYTKMQGGSLNSKLVQSGDGPYEGPVQIRNFEVVNEERLKNISSGFQRELQIDHDSRHKILQSTQERSVKFNLANAQIERGKGYLNVSDANVHNTAIGITFTGKLYDPKDHMNISGTFMLANTLNQVVATIPILGQLLSNGRDNALFGVTYQLKGPRSNPQLVVNPLSIVAPGVFNRVFEFQQ